MDEGRKDEQDEASGKARGTRDEMTVAKRINSVRDLDVYRLAFDAAIQHL
jgi:hypothetical protein